MVKRVGGLRPAASIQAMMLAALAAAVLWIGAGAGDSRAAEAFDLRFGAQNGEQRVVLELSEPTPYRIFTLEQPYRVVIDLPEIDWRFSAPTPPDGVVKAARFGLFQPGRSRMVLDLNAPARGDAILHIRGERRAASTFGSGPCAAKRRGVRPDGRMAQRRPSGAGAADAAAEAEKHRRPAPAGDRA